MYNVSFTPATSIYLKFALCFSYRNLALIWKNTAAHMDQAFQFLFPLSSYACSLFVTWPHSLFTEHCPRLHPKIEFCGFYKAFRYDGDVPNINFHNRFLRWGCKCAGRKIRKNKCFQKFNTSLTKWRSLQKLRSEVEMTQILVAFGTFDIKSDLNKKSRFLKARSLIPCF